MKGINPNWPALLSIAIFIEMGIGTTPTMLNHMVPADWIPSIGAWSLFLGWAGSGAAGILGLSSSSATGLLIRKPTVASALVFAVVLLALVLAPVPASASDVASPVAKALTLPAAAPCVVGTTATPTSCSGWYVGAGVGGNGTNANIVGNGINGSVFAAGVMPFVTGGYQYVQGNWTFGFDLKGGYQVGSNPTVNTINTNADGFRFIETFRAGGNAAALLGSQQQISVPPLLKNSLLTFYGEVGTAQRQLVNKWANGLASGAGALFDVGPTSFIDLEYVNIQYNNASGAGVTVPSENLLLLSYKHKF